MNLARSLRLAVEIPADGSAARRKQMDPNKTDLAFWLSGFLRF